MAKTLKGKISAKAPKSSSTKEVLAPEGLSDDTDSGLEDEDELHDLSSDEESDQLKLSDNESEDEKDEGEESDDEVDENQEESNDESVDENQSDDEFPLRKKKKTADDGRQTFASAFSAIMGSKLKAYDRKDPILARNKAVLKQLESTKLEERAKRALSGEKAELLDKNHVADLLPSADEPEKARAYLDKERALKKTAQRGVVKLFNAVMATQTQTSEELSLSSVGPQRKTELMNEVTKLTFLDMVKAAGEE